MDDFSNKAPSSDGPNGFLLQHNRETAGPTINLQKGLLHHHPSIPHAFSHSHQKQQQHPKKARCKTLPTILTHGASLPMGMLRNRSFSRSTRDERTRNCNHHGIFPLTYSEHHCRWPSFTHIQNASSSPSASQIPRHEFRLQVEINPHPSRTRREKKTQQQSLTRE